MEERGMRLRKRSKYEREETKLMTCNCSINVEIIYRNITTFFCKILSSIKLFFKGKWNCTCRFEQFIPFYLTAHASFDAF